MCAGVVVCMVMVLGFILRGLADVEMLHADSSTIINRSQQSASVVFTCRRSPSVVIVVLKKAPLPCDDGSAGSPLGLSWHPMRRTPYPQRIRIYRPQTGQYQAAGRLAQAAAVGRSPTEHSLPAEGWSVYGQFVLLLIEGCTS